jgi:hypothetical protein
MKWVCWPFIQSLAGLREWKMRKLCLNGVLPWLRSVELHIVGKIAGIMPIFLGIG